MLCTASSYDFTEGSAVQAAWKLKVERRRDIGG